MKKKKRQTNEYLVYTGWMYFMRST